MLNLAKRLWREEKGQGWLSTVDFGTHAIVAMVA